MHIGKSATAWSGEDDLMALALKLAEFSEIEQAVEIAQIVHPVSIGDLEWVPHDSMLELIAELLKQDAFEQAIQLAERLQSLEPKNVYEDLIKQEILALIEIGKALSASGQSGQADVLFNNALEQVQSAFGVINDSTYYHFYDQVNQAEVMIEIGDAFRRSGQPKQADELFDKAFERAVRIANEIRDHHISIDLRRVTRVQNLIELGDSLNQLGRYEQAHTLFDTAFQLTRRAFREPISSIGHSSDADPDDLVWVRRYIALAFLAADQAQLAARLTEDLALEHQDNPYQTDCEGNSDCQLAPALAKQGQFEAALAFAEVVAPPGIQARMLAAIAIELQKLRSLEE